MTKDRALKLLGLSGDPTESEIRAAYRKEAWANHPDTALEVPLYPKDMATLQEARDHLLSLLDDHKKTCILCNGVGYVGGMKCSACKGSGLRG